MFEIAASDFWGRLFNDDLFQFFIITSRWYQISGVCVSLLSPIDYNSFSCHWPKFSFFKLYIKGLVSLVLMILICSFLPSENIMLNALCDNACIWIFVDFFNISYFKIMMKILSSTHRYCSTSIKNSHSGDQ